LTAATARARAVSIMWRMSLSRNAAISSVIFSEIGEIGRRHAAPVSFKDYRFPPDIIYYDAWLYYRFPLSLRMVEEMLAARGVELAYETVRS
jgi:hypothetical protein